MATLSGGDKLAAALEDISKRMSGGSVRVGFLEGATYPEDGTPVAQVAFWNEYGTAKIPARPFFRAMIEHESDDWGAMLGKAAVHYEYDAQAVMKAMGMTISEQLKMAIFDWQDPPNSLYTVEKKGFNKPLIDTSHMQNSVDFEVGE